MTLALYLQCGFMFMLGQGLHLFWIKLPSFKEKALAANKPFSYKEWWECDKWLVIGLQLAGISIFMGLDQIFRFKPEIIDYTKWFFWAIGAFGSNLLFQKFSQYAKGQTKIIDLKANIADILTGGTSTVKETLEKGSQVTGGADVSVAPVKTN